MTWNGNGCMLYGILITLCVAPLFSPADKADTWSGLGTILMGARVGMPLPEFLGRHPKAYNSDMAEMRKPVDPAAANISLEEQFNKDPFLGLWCLANYGFKEGKLYEYSVLWFDRAAKIDALTGDFLRACVQRHGPEFRGEAMKVNEGKSNEYLAPVVMWTTQSCVTLVSCSTYTDEKKGPQGSFTYTVFSPGDPFLETQLAGKKLNTDALNRIFEKIAPELNKAVKSVTEKNK